MCDQSGAKNIEEDVEVFLERAPAMLLELAAEEVEQRHALMIAIRQPEEQGSSTRLAEELREIALGRQFEAIRRALKGDSPARVEPVKVTRKYGVHTVRV